MVLKIGRFDPRAYCAVHIRSAAPVYSLSTTPHGLTDFLYEIILLAVEFSNTKSEVLLECKMRVLQGYKKFLQVHS
jgi:hypothetical protein